MWTLQFVVPLALALNGNVTAPVAGTLAYEQATCGIAVSTPLTRPWAVPLVNPTTLVLPDPKSTTPAICVVPIGWLTDVFKALGWTGTTWEIDAIWQGPMPGQATNTPRFTIQR